MKISFVYIILGMLLFQLPNELFAQEKVNNSMDNCVNLFSREYVPSGQDYVAKLDQNNKATFHTTFYGGTQYRIIACSNFDNPRLVLKVYDIEKNLLFSNLNYNYTPYWNLSFSSTVDCIVEISVESEQLIKKPVKLLIGFKKKSLNFD
jgi:hypothetical protein